MTEHDVVSCPSHRSSWRLACVGLGVVLSGCGLTLGFRPGQLAVRYIAFGDSTTTGGARRQYPELLAELLAEPPEKIANEGKGGETSAEGLSRLREILAQPVYPRACALLYWEGGNDLIDFIRGYDPDLAYSPSEPGYPFATDLEEVLSGLEQNVTEAITAGAASDLCVLVATYFPVAPEAIACEPLTGGVLDPAQAETADEYVHLLNERLRSAAMREGALLVEIWEAGPRLRQDPANYLDCNHLSTPGNRMAAEEFRNVLAICARCAEGEP